MNKIISLCMLMGIGLTAVAQQEPHLAPPKTHWQSYGFQKPVRQVSVGYYKSDSTGYQPAMLEVYTFNDAGHLIQKYIRIFGSYASETAHQYVYTDGQPDSINTLASAPDFNTKQKLQYNADRQLVKGTATGKWSNFTDAYTYDEGGMVACIERIYTAGGRKQACFNHQRNYVSEKKTDRNGQLTEHCYVYDGEELFASFTLGGQPVVTFYHAGGSRSDFETEIREDALNYTLEYRQLKQGDPQAYDRKIEALQGQPSSRVLFEIPAEARNEEGDWIKRLQIDKRFAQPERRLVFRKLVYSDGTESGSTDYDMIFEHKVSGIQ